ncbi:hypothetical protein [Pedobacter deserti]|uniref:hypothetical protein n=1 Tax=Pedobacter deserti TaxID=2817382 RepID=UPI00210A6C02|nr:hypothetical protein [Pedobacter sp. SYSU D00382]
MRQSDKTVTKGFLFAIVAAILWGISGTFGQFLFRERGVNVTFTHGNFNSLAISPMALFLGLASAVALAIYTLQPRELLSQYRASVVIGSGMLCGGITISLIKAPGNVDGVWDLYTYLYTGLNNQL